MNLDCIKALPISSGSTAVITSVSCHLHQPEATSASCGIKV